MFGEGGRECSGPAAAAAVRVRLRHDRFWRPDPVLADETRNATGGQFVFGVMRNCTHLEKKKVYIQTTSGLNQTNESPRATLVCIAS